jgi:general secretion pathway protein F
MAEAIESATKNIREGQSIAQPLKDSGEFPSLVTHMIAIGERTGDLEPMLEKVSIAYEAESERTFDALTALLEPLLILVMGGTLGFVAVALLLPLLQMSNLSGA